MLQLQRRTSWLWLWFVGNCVFASYLVSPWSPLPKREYRSSVRYLKPTGQPPTWLASQSASRTRLESVRDKLRQHISVTANNASIEQVLRSISEQLGVPIKISSTLESCDHNYHQKVTIDYANTRANQMLLRLLPSYDLSWDIQEDAVIILHEDELEQRYRNYDLSWILQDSSPVEDVVGHINDLCWGGHAVQIGSLVVVQATEPEHLMIEEFLAQLSGLFPQNARNLAY